MRNHSSSARPTRRHLLTLAACGAVTPFTAAAQRPADLRLGVNAGVSFNEAEDEQRRRFGSLADALGRDAGLRLDLGVVYSDRVARALEAASFDLLLIHTHAALRAEREAGWQLLAFSRDRKDNAVYFFVRPEHRAMSLQDLAGVDIGAPGLHSWATATARGALRLAAPGMAPRFKPTRLQEVVPYMVELRAVAAGVCRSRAVVDDAVGAGRVRVVHVTPALPLYALIAAPQVAPALCERLRLACAGLDARALQGTPLQALEPGGEQATRLRGFFLG